MANKVANNVEDVEDLYLCYDAYQDYTFSTSSRDISYLHFKTSDVWIKSINFSLQFPKINWPTSNMPFNIPHGQHGTQFFILRNTINCICNWITSSLRTQHADLISCSSSRGQGINLASVDFAYL